MSGQVRNQYAREYRDAANHETPYDHVNRLHRAWNVGLVSGDDVAYAVSSLLTEMVRLRVDLADARRERDERQQRLEAVQGTLDLWANEAGQVDVAAVRAAIYISRRPLDVDDIRRGQEIAAALSAGGGGPTREGDGDE